MLNKGEERVDGIMRVPPRSDAQLVVSEGVMELRKGGESGNENSFKQLGQHTAQENTSVGGGIEFGFRTALVYRLE